MKKILKILWNNIKIVLGFCLIVCTFYFGYNYLNKLFRTPDVDYNDSFHNMPEDSVDVVVLGSSHAQYSFVPSFFYEDTGLYSYVLGSAFQPLKVSYQMLREALKTQNPEMVILEVYTACLDEETVNDTRYTIAEYQMTGEEKYNTIDFIEDEGKKKEYYNDFLNNHNNWKNIESIDELLSVDTNTDSMFGYIENNVYLPVDNYWYSFKYDENIDISLRDDDLNALNDIYSLCKENGIELLLYMVPMDNVTQIAQSYLHNVWNWASERDVNYIDFLTNDEKMDIRSVIHHDGFHTYLNGASYVTNVIGKYINDNYQFNRHTDNSKLNELYKVCTEDLTFHTLQSEANASKFLCRIVNYPYLTIMMYSGTYLNDELLEYINQMNLPDFSDGEDYYAVIYNGEVLAYGKEELSYDYESHRILINENGVYYDEQLICDGELLNFTIFRKDNVSSTSKVIDYLNGELWDYKFDYDYNSK